MMTEDELNTVFDLLDGFMAHDHGATDSGIHHPENRREITTWLLSQDRDARLLVVGRFLRQYDYQMGSEDESEALRWFRDQGVI